ncbi:hypothetical protein X801_05799 [Opisthorchis viverrini]|nr:hypothetical protein X801_05799 [Opisthorchis viverrini]
MSDRIAALSRAICSSPTFTCSIRGIDRVTDQSTFLTSGVRLQACSDRSFDWPSLKEPMTPTTMNRKFNQPGKTGQNPVLKKINVF